MYSQSATDESRGYLLFYPRFSSLCEKFVFRQNVIVHGRLSPDRYKFQFSSCSLLTSKEVLVKLKVGIITENKIKCFITKTMIQSIGHITCKDSWMGSNNLTVIFNRYYEFDTAYCNGNESDYESSDMKMYMDIRKWGKYPDKLKPGRKQYLFCSYFVNHFVHTHWNDEILAYFVFKN